jgi:hypothetical protein
MRNGQVTGLDSDEMSWLLTTHFAVSLQSSTTKSLRDWGRYSEPPAEALRSKDVHGGHHCRFQRMVASMGQQAGRRAPVGGKKMVSRIHRRLRGRRCRGWCQILTMSEPTLRVRRSTENTERWPSLRPHSRRTSMTVSVEPNTRPHVSLSQEG